MAKGGMSRRVCHSADPTYTEALGHMRKETKTMAEKMEERGVIGKDSISILLRAKSIVTDAAGRMPKLTYQAKQAATAADVDAVEDELWEMEQGLFQAARAVSAVRHRTAAVKVDLLPRPKGERHE